MAGIECPVTDLRPLLQHSTDAYLIVRPSATGYDVVWSNPAASTCPLRATALSDVFATSIVTPTKLIPGVAFPAQLRSDGSPARQTLQFITFALEDGLLLLQGRHPNDAAPSLSMSLSQSTSKASNSRREELPSCLRDITGEMAQLLKNFDWESTSVGPISQWPRTLITTISLCFRSAFPFCLFWGEDMTFFYNDAYVHLAGAKHPRLFGQRGRDAWHEIWDVIGPMLEEVMRGKAIFHHDKILYLERHGFPEETFFTWSYSPVLGQYPEAEDRVMGVITFCFESTRSVINQRRMKALVSMAADSAWSHDMSAMLTRVSAALSKAYADLPFFHYYSVEEDGESRDDQLTMKLSLSLGCAPESIGLPAVLKIGSRDQLASPWPFQAVVKDKRPHDLTGMDKLFPGCPRSKSHRWPVSTAIVTPLLLATGREPTFAGIIVCGICPHLVLDDLYRSFIEVLAFQFASLRGSISAFETEVERSRILSHQVEMRTKELSQSELRYRTLAALSPVGVYHLNLQGQVTYANERWWEISGHDRVRDPNINNFMDSIHPEDKGYLVSLFEKEVFQGKASTAEFRWRAKPGDTSERWTLGQTQVEHDGHGEAIGFVGTLTDLSYVKKLEAEARKALQDASEGHKRRAEEAEEMKRRQDLFIDTVCHELRNPLSAVHANAEMLCESLDSMCHSSTTTPPLIDALREDLAKAQTILHCSVHQKSIVDDVLNLSRLEFEFTHDKQKRFQPDRELHVACRMFSTAAEQKQLRITPIVADSVRRLGVTWVRGDPNRFSQVIINLLSNAIKFSIDRGSEITVRLEASPTPPVFSENGNSSTSSTVQLSALEATSPQDAYVIVSVGDQGMGMTGDERKRMFRRFSQASQKTYSNFGGSGLGLYICKVLVEKQGGDITVESEPGKGTLFTFYMRYELIPASDWPSDGEETTVRSLQISPMPPPSAPAETVSSPSKDFAATGGTHTVLIVEDNRINQRVLQQQLRSLHYSSAVANNGLEAVEMVQKEPELYKLILMDLEMPVMGGLDAAVRIREWERTTNRQLLPIVALTGNAREEHREKAHASGMNSLMTKPYSKSDLMTLLQQFCPYTS